MIFKKILHILVSLISLISLGSCIVIANEINYAEMFISAAQIFIDFFIVSPIIFITLMLALHIMLPICMRLGQEIFIALLGINILNMTLLLYLVSNILRNQYGLWILKVKTIEHVVYQSHFLPPGVGYIGIYMTICSYLFYRFLSHKYSQSSFLKACLYLFSFAPVVGYFIIIYLHRFIPKPGYVG